MAAKTLNIKPQTSGSLFGLVLFQNKRPVFCYFYSEYFSVLHHIYILVNFRFHTASFLPFFCDETVLLNLLCFLYLTDGDKFVRVLGILILLGGTVAGLGLKCD